MTKANHNGERCIIYCRVSTLEQKREGLSLEAQEDICRSYADDNRFTVVRLFSEDESASIAERRKFNEMLGWMSAQNIHHLLVEKMDRFHRNMQGEDIIKDHKLTVHFVKDGMTFNWQSSSAVQKFMFRVQSAQTAYTSDNISEEAIKGMKKKLEQGGVVQYAPIGYLNDKIQHTAVADPDRFDRMKKIWDLALTGNHSLENLAKIASSIGLTSKSGKPLAKTDLHRILNNHFYYGMIPWPGKKVDWGRELWPNTGINNDRPPSYPPMITKYEFDRVQDILSGRRNNWITKRGRDFLFKGIFKCAQCGRSLLGEAKTVTLKSGKTMEIVFYHCTNGQYYVDKDGSPVGKQFVDTQYLILKAVFSLPEEVSPGVVKEITYGKIGDPVIQKTCEGILPWPKEEELERDILIQLDYLANPEALDILKERLGETVREFMETAEDQMRHLKKRRSEIEGMISRLWERSLQPDSLVKEEDFQAQLERLKTERDDIKEKIRDLEDANDVSIDEAIEVIELSKSIKKKYLASGTATRNYILKQLYRTIYVWPRDPELPDHLSMNFVYNQPFTHYYVEGLIRADAEMQRKGHGIFPKSEKWRGRRDSNSRPLA